MDSIVSEESFHAPAIVLPLIARHCHLRTQHEGMVRCNGRRRKLCLDEGKPARFRRLSGMCSKPMAHCVEVCVCHCPERQKRRSWPHNRPKSGESRFVANFALSGHPDLKNELVPSCSSSHSRGVSEIRSPLPRSICRVGDRLRSLHCLCEHGRAKCQVNRVNTMLCRRKEIDHAHFRTETKGHSADSVRQVYDTQSRHS
jgi:hypothetical protein